MTSLQRSSIFLSLQEYRTKAALNIVQTKVNTSNMWFFFLIWNLIFESMAIFPLYQTHSIMSQFHTSQEE